MDAQDYVLGDFYTFYLRGGQILGGVVIERDYAGEYLRIQEGVFIANDSTPVTIIRLEAIDAVEAS